MYGEYEESKENEFRKRLSNSIESRSRTPLNTISNPSQTIASSSSTRKTTRAVSNNSAVVDFEIEQDPSFWIHNNVQVLVRIRPINNNINGGQRRCCCLRQENSNALIWLGHPETRFTFDHVASQNISQEKLFRVAGFPMVENCMSGYNSCIFAYGQTGSGKTYTMMGEINKEMKCGNLNEHCGITPRVFQYLFTRISAEEDNRRDEKLKYSCKCSFLEIYNEQITDLLEPSSTNLQLREDLKKGVYVENLTEYDVTIVTDVIKLLVRGAANRKMAASNMNSESSRSHSVFTCIIESRWEEDSISHFRFARLNLVDLAGSERQKSSGAEGDRLKEAANINKSLSTLGLVIMSLVDLAQGKQRHVPYRDSRLTFLLQDSLGGNSKTMIIANVSPSISSVNESLSTLKFAQRAKLIQNNAKVNEDPSGDVFALQQQIQHLKGQLSYLLNRHNLSRFLSYQFSEEANIDKLSEELYIPGGGSMDDYHRIQNVHKNVETILLKSIVGDEMVSHNQADNGVQKTYNNQKRDGFFAIQPHVTQRELETSKTTLHLQEEIAHLPLELQDRVCSIIQENSTLKETVAAKEDEIRAVRLEWERATIELTNFLIEGSRSLKDASSQIKGIACSFPQVNAWISEHVERAAKVCIEREETILLLQNSLEDAQNMVKEMELKLCFLKIATTALKQSQQLKNEEITMLPLKLSSLFDENIQEINVPEIDLKHIDDEAIEAECSRDKCCPLSEELERKEDVLRGLLFDFTLLQESASNTKDIKDENEKLVLNLDQVQHELEMKICQLNDILIQHRKLDATVLISNSELDQAREMIATLSEQNAELRMELKDLYFNKSEVEEQLKELKEAVKSFENEILRMNSPIEDKFISVEDIEDELCRVASERDQLREEVYHLIDKLEMAHALADENEAVSVEARQELEASKIHAEQKDEEVMILERSVEELECTIDVLEKKVYEMDEELERYQLIRDSLEVELQALRQRMLTVEKFTDSVDSVNKYMDQGTHMKQSSDLQNGRMEVEKADDHIRVVKEERAEHDREIKQLKEYISEILLHAEAQSSQYQQKYKTLEAMVHEVQADSLNSAFDKTEKRSTRTRGSGSPFRCIASMVQQINVEKDQELSIARLRIRELEALAASRQNEVCVLNSRLATTESMTYDVIRDLLGVKVDMTNYVNLIDQQHVQKLMGDAQQQTEDSLAKEILNLRQQISNLREDRERREEDILAAHMDVEQLQDRDQLLAAQNEMLKMDKINLKQKIAELDKMVKCLYGKQNIQQRMQNPRMRRDKISPSNN